MSEATTLTFNFAGKRAVVTGAASGIGNAVAQLFAVSGASVALVDLDPERTSAAAAALPRATAHACDVSQEAAVAAAFAQIEAQSPIDILVNCAGIAHVGSLATTTPADLDRLYNVNVRGTYLTMRAALTPMLARGQGIILNMASIAASAGLEDRFAYSMTKGAVLAMTLSVARDYIGKGIRCNCVSPARVFTPFVEGYLKKNYPGREEQQKAVLAAAQPIGRMGTPAEIASLCLYLCSDAASFITGVDYPIDGGFVNLR